jgi:cytochrome P450
MLKKPVIPPIPGPQGTELLRKITQIQHNPLEYLLQATEQYGDLVQFPIGNLMVYLVNHPDLIKHILQDNHRNYTKNTIQYNQLATITGRGLLTSDGDYWFRQRRLAQPAFHRNRLATLDHIIVQTTMEMLADWGQHTTNSTVIDIDQEMMKLTLRIVGKTLFSIDLGMEAQNLTRAVLETLEHIVYKASHFLALPESVPTYRNRKFRAALKTLDTLVFQMIRDRRASLNKPDDLLTLFIDARDLDSGEKMSDRQIRDEILTILIAGHETVASALTWCWYLLSKHPLVFRCMQQEIKDVLTDNLPTYPDLEQLHYTKQVFDETLRLYPPAWLITRKSVAADKLGSYEVPASSLFILSPYVLHRHPNFWNNPLGFDPDRFTPANSQHHPKFGYIPFGGGPRLCIGDRFANIEALLILAVITQKYELHLVPWHQVQVVPLVTLRPKQGVLMTIRLV